MVLQYLINLPVLLASLYVLLAFKSDITLYLCLAIMVALSVRVLLAEASPASRGTLFLIQATLFGVGIWYALYPKRLSEALMLLGIG